MLPRTTPITLGFRNNGKCHRLRVATISSAPASGELFASQNSLQPAIRSTTRSAVRNLDLMIIPFAAEQRRIPVPLDRIEKTYDS